ncbi:MAG: protein translocase subunit SecDF [Flavobacteriales bacterium]|nr:protein translocase subunit SecDF [Flavobacteriales bacterium]|tara:strand:- start:13982 stop:16984 length:3003 start_codon:yes stop_codon:yes gene_type:complete
MQNRNFIKLFTILFALVSLYQLSFTWVADGVEDDALIYASKFPANQQEEKERFYLDSINSEPVYDIFLTEYSYADCKSRELNLGLDLKGGMNVTLEVMVVDVLKALANNSKDSIFNAAIKNTLVAQRNSQDDFVSLFAFEYEKLSPNNGLAVLFAAQLKDKIKINANNNEVIDIISIEVEDAISRSFNILRSRIDRFGVTQPNIQRLETAGRILVELPGIKDPERARKLLQSTAQLEFWETYEYAELFESLESVNKYLRDIENAKNESEELLENNDVDIEKEVKESANSDINEDSEESSLLADVLSDDSLSTDSLSTDLSFEEFATENPLYAVLFPNVNQQTNQLNPGPVVGICAIKDTAQVNKYLSDKSVMKMFPLDVVFSYTVKPYDADGKFVQLVALKSNRGGKAAMEGDVVTDANETFGQFSSTAEVSMEMNAEGAKQWKRLTKENIGKSVAIVLDGYVYSYPTVQSEIAGGRSSITGNFTLDEAKDLANILKSGKLPAPARIIEEAIVGPSLGQEAISSGLNSFVIALILVLIYITFYYGGAGLTANTALLVNIFFIFGVLSSLGAVLTLPGIAGIILTIGMSIDANVLIYERIREEMRNGKGLKLAITDGYNSAYSSIIDANVTTLLTGIILYTFGTGPIKGFATTLVIGILTSLFAAIFITRLIISSRLDKGKTISFSTKMTKGAFQNININFIDKRKRFYVFSSVLILIGLGSLFTKGLHLGVDFSGGRTYVVRFSENIDNEALRSSLSSVFVDEDGLNYSPQVKTFGDDNQVKITTSFMIENNEISTDEIVESKLSEGLEMTGLDYEIMSSQKVGPTIADDIKDAALWSIIFSLIVIFLYILVRFRRWQFSLGAVIAAFHDVLVVLSLFSIFYGILPFSLEIDQAFIAAILTIIGYSLNDTVVVFDRVREFLNNNKKRGVHEVINSALNSTLSRTINTSVTTMFVLLIIFVFGGEVIRGFMFALMVGVLVGTYSSLFIASPIMLDTISKKN